MAKIIPNGNGIIEGLENYSFNEVCEIIMSHLSDCIRLYDMDCEIKAISLHGSRIRLTSKADSDLDAVVEYIGSEREDDCFNIFNENPLIIEGVIVDINPISEHKTGNIQTYLTRSNLYDTKFI